MTQKDIHTCGCGEKKVQLLQDVNKISITTVPYDVRVGEWGRLRIKEEIREKGKIKMVKWQAGEEEKVRALRPLLNLVTPKGISFSNRALGPNIERRRPTHR